MNHKGGELNTPVVQYVNAECYAELSGEIVRSRECSRSLSWCVLYEVLN